MLPRLIMTLIALLTPTGPGTPPADRAPAVSPRASEAPSAEQAEACQSGEAQDWDDDGACEDEI